MALELAVLAPLGAASVTLAASINSALQLASEPQMRGRVMALYSIVFLGSTPIGAPLAGWLSEAIDPRAALVMAGVAGIVAGLLARGAFARVAPTGARARNAHLPPRNRRPRRRPTAIHGGRSFKRPRQDGQGYVSGALLGGYVVAPGDGRRHCGKRLEPMSRKAVLGVRPSTNSPDAMSIHRGMAQSPIPKIWVLDVRLRNGVH